MSDYLINRVRQVPIKDRVLVTVRIGPHNKRLVIPAAKLNGITCEVVTVGGDFPLLCERGHEIGRGPFWIWMCAVVGVGAPAVPKEDRRVACRNGIAGVVTPKECRVVIRLSGGPVRWLLARIRTPDVRRRIDRQWVREPEPHCGPITPWKVKACSSASKGSRAPNAKDDDANGSDKGLGALRQP